MLAIAWISTLLAMYSPVPDWIMSFGGGAAFGPMRFDEVIVFHVLLSVLTLVVLVPVAVVALWRGDGDDRAWAGILALAFVFDVPYGLFLELAWHVQIMGAPDLH